MIMVTHNAELAERYSTRIVRILDGEIISDSMPYSTENSDLTRLDDVNIAIDAKEISEQNADGTASSLSLDAKAESICETYENENIEKTKNKRRKKRRKFVSMPFWTSVKLSFRNLLNKRGKSILTAVAGSIGIISIALILAVNNGFSIYINNYEQQSMARYPITVSTGESSMLSIFEQFLGGNDLHGDSIDMDSILSIFTGEESDKEKYPDEEIVYVFEQFVKAFEAQMDNISKTRTSRNSKRIWRRISIIRWARSNTTIPLI